MSGARVVLAAVVAVFVVGCGGAQESTEASAQGALRGELPAAGASGISLMTQNLYVGADVEALYTTPAPLIPHAVTLAFQQLQATDFPARAQRIADEVEASRPDVIGLQEVSLIRTQFPGDFFFGNPVAATDVAYDYLAILLAALEERGLEYQVAAVVDDTDVEVPSDLGAPPPYGMDIRLTDRDVLLVRSGLSYSSPQAQNYSVNFSFPFGGPGGPVVTVLRGWVAADVTVGARTVHVTNTHLDDASSPALVPIQTAQAAELLASVADEALPTILIGDFNSAADGSTTPAYGMLVDAGFIDAWAQAHPRDPGYTCCQAGDLLNPTSQLSERVDLVMVRQPNEPERILGGVAAAIVGNEPSDKTFNGLWPSDHAGMVSLLRLARGRPMTGTLAEGRGGGGGGVRLRDPDELP